MEATLTQTSVHSLGSRVLVRPLEAEERTKSGIYLPETAKENPQTGVVVAVGDDETIKVAPDDRVLFAKYTGTEIMIDGKPHLIL
ncbi:MAG: co-chaperone GroES [Anaerolineae bacterium]